MIAVLHRNRMPEHARALVAALALAALIAPAAADDATIAPAPPPPQAVPPAPALPSPPDVLGAIGRMIDQSIQNVGAGVNAGVKGAGETLGATTNAAGDIAKGVTDAAGTVVRLPATNVVSGFERCAVAPNGAPDCSGASLALCRSKGFERGNSLDITSSYKCPVQMWREGRAPNERDCKDESFVSRAICQ